jgi:hypothetical protein
VKACERGLLSAKTTFFGRFPDPVFQSKTPSYSQGVAANYTPDFVPKREVVEDSAARQTGKHNAQPVWPNHKQQTHRKGEIL